MRDDVDQCPLVEYNEAEGWIAAILEPLPQTLEMVQKDRVTIFLNADKKMVAARLADIKGFIKDEEERALAQAPLPPQMPGEDISKYLLRTMEGIEPLSMAEFPHAFWNKEGDQIEIYAGNWAFYGGAPKNGVEILRDQETGEPIGVHIMGIRRKLLRAREGGRDPRRGF